MKCPIVMLAAAAAVALACSAQAADLIVAATNAVKPALEDLVPVFERANGHKVSLKFGVAAVVKRDLEGGAPFDLAIITSGGIADLVKQGKITAGSETPIARSGIGMMVRSGATKPDLSSAATLKQAVLSAKSITWVKEGASGVYFASLLEKLGIRDAVKPVLAVDGVDAARKVASGEADLGALLINEIMAQPGVDLAGPLPAELQSYTPFSSGVAASSKNAAAAKALADYLITPDARAVFKAKGQEPGGAGL